MRRDGVSADAIGGALFGFGTYVGKVFKCLENGVEDSVEFFYKVATGSRRTS